MKIILKFKGDFMQLEWSFYCYLGGDSAEVENLLESNGSLSVGEHQQVKHCHASCAHHPHPKADRHGHVLLQFIELNALRSFHTGTFRFNIKLR